MYKCTCLSPRQPNGPHLRSVQYLFRRFMLDENARMLTQMLTTTGGAISQSPLAPPIPQAQPRQKQQPQQQQRRSPKSHRGGLMSHHSDDRLSPQGEDEKYGTYARPGLPPGGQLEQGQRSGTRFGSRSPTAGGAGQIRQREVTRGPALVSVVVCPSPVSGCLSVCLPVCLSQVSDCLSVRHQ